MERVSSKASSNNRNINYFVDQDLPAAEFASDAFASSLLNPDDLEREMKELGMDGSENVPEWEHELQKELQVTAMWL